MRELKAKTPPSRIGAHATFMEMPGSQIEIQLSVEVTRQPSPGVWTGKVKTSSIQVEFTLEQEVTMTRKSGNVFTIQ